MLFNGAALREAQSAGQRKSAREFRGRCFLSLILQVPEIGAKCKKLFPPGSESFPVRIVTIVACG
jgi:hypothetical protein